MGELAAFEHIIRGVMDNNDQTRQAAEEEFKRIQQTAPDEWARLMIQCIRSSADPGIRNLSTVLMRSECFDKTEGKENSKWPFISAPVRAMLMTEFLAALEAEPERTTARKICDLIGETYAWVASQKSEWPELLPLLFQWTRQERPELRECALIIFARVCGYAAKQMRQYFEVLKEIFEAGLGDPELKVRLSALNATAMFLVAQPKDAVAERMYFLDLLPAMLEVISQALNAGDQDTAIKATQFFIDIAELDPKFLRRDLGPVVGAMLQIVTCEDLSDSTRHMALEFLTKLAESRAQMCRKLPQFNDVLPAIFNMMVDLEDDEDWANKEDEDAVAVTNSDFAEQALDRLSEAMTGKWMVPAAFALIPDLLKNPNWKFRHAALIAVSAIAEGSSDVMEEGLGTIVAACLPSMQDPHPRVVYAACQCFGQLCIDFEPGFQNTFHGQVIPALLGVMGDSAVPRTQAHAAAALLNLVQHLERELIFPYLNPILTRLFECLQNGKTKVQEQVLSAIASVAELAKDRFEEYYDIFMPMLKSILLNAHGRDYRVLRGKSMEAISMIGRGVGRVRFLNDAKEVMQVFIESDVTQLAVDDPQIPYLVMAWGRMASCLLDEFLPYLPIVMPPLLAAAKVAPTLYLSEAEEAEEHKPGWESVVLGDSRLSVKTDAGEDKAQACRMLVCYARDLKEGFFPYVGAVSEIMIPLLSFYFHDGVRIAAADSCAHLVRSAMLYVANGGDASLETVKAIFDNMFEKLLKVVHEEPDIEVLQPQLNALAALVMAGGPDTLSQMGLTTGARVLAELLNDAEKRRHKRDETRREDDYDEATEDVLGDHNALDEAILREIVQVNNSFLKTHGTRYFPVYMDVLHGIFMELFTPARSPGERQWALCVFDDTIEYASPDAHVIVPMITDLMLQYLRDENPEVRQAACYGFGVCAQYAPQIIASVAQRAIDGMRLSVLTHAEREKEDANPSDNAISAMVKFCHFLPQESSPEEIMPYCIEMLPLHDDAQEAVYINGVLLELIEQNNPLALGDGGSNIPKLVSVLVGALGTNFTNEDLTPRIVHFVKQIHASAPEGLQGIVASLPEADQAKVAAILSS